MQKLLRGLGILFMAFLLVFASAFSMAGTQSTAAQEIQWQEMEGKTTKELDKTWTIKFTTNLDASSINENNLFIVNADGEKVETAFTVDKNLVKISPKADYVNGQYTLYIGPDIKSAKGKALKTPIKFQFLVDADVIGTPVIFPSNQIPMNFADGGFRLAVALTAATDKLKAYDEENNVSSVMLYSKNDEGEWIEAGPLFDSGNLYQHSDEIRGDGVYSVNLQGKIDTSVAKQLELKVEAELKDGTKLAASETLTIIQTSNGENVTEIMNVSSNTQYEVSTFAAENPDVTASELEGFVEEYLAKQESVESVKEESTGLLEVTYNSGLKSLIQIVEEEDEEAGVRSASSSAAAKAVASVRAPKAAAGDERRSDLSNVPLEKQTTGTNYNVMIPRKPTVASDPNEVSSRSALLWAPFHNEFSPWTEEQTLETIFGNSPTGFTVQKLQNEQADINALKTMTNYGFVLLSTHGSGGKWILTGEAAYDSTKYEIEQIQGEIALTQHMIITEKNGVQVKAPVYAVNHKWVEKHLPGTFDNTIIINSSCESTKTDNLWNAFSAKGAGAYYGFSEIVSSKFAHDKSIEIVENLVNEGKTTGESFVPAQDPYISLKAAIQLKGNTSLEFAQNKDGETNLVNGDFEQQLLSWHTDGDGRVISGLGSPQSVLPTSGKGMGVISTGLGYTTSMGEMKQTFFMSEKASTLAFDWNYLSEEFLEFIGSGYEDPFTVTLKTNDGANEEILRLTVNTLAQQFNATQSDGGSLLHVSPDIVFDSGDVWMTDWQNVQYTIPDSFKGKVVTLTFSAQDAGDTVLDTAVLLDNINVQ